MRIKESGRISLSLIFLVFSHLSEREIEFRLLISPGQSREGDPKGTEYFYGLGILIAEVTYENRSLRMRKNFYKS